MITGFRHAAVVVRDMQKAIRFYRDRLGLRVEKVITIKGEHLEAIFNKKGIILRYAKLYAPGQHKTEEPLFELHCWKKTKIVSKKGHNHVSFTIKDLDSEYKRLSKLRVRFISGPHISPASNSKLCFCYDPDNNLIEFVEDL
ncbi:MAG: VOC family protein [Candidatus Omnitrophota bacterium]